MHPELKVRTFRAKRPRDGGHPLTLVTHPEDRAGIHRRPAVRGRRPRGSRPRYAALQANPDALPNGVFAARRLGREWFSDQGHGERRRDRHREGEKKSAHVAERKWRGGREIIRMDTLQDYILL